MAETKSTTAKTLPDAIFSVEVPNHQLLKLAYDSYLAQARTSAGRTKQRGEVSGGGKKPWKQKGTGRARFGSSRNPIWRGGGVVFGPRGNENYKLKISTRAKRQAVRQALTLANQDQKIIVVPSIKTTGKVKDTVKFLAGHKLENKRRILMVVEAKTPELIRATNNLPNVELLNAKYLSVYLVLNADTLVMTEKAIEIVLKWLKEEKR